MGVTSDTNDRDDNQTMMDRKSAKLTSPAFLALVITQFLGAANDNIFRWLAIGVGKQYVGGENPAEILMAGTACFVLPYLILASVAGYLADRFSKRNVIVACKVAEVVIMIVGIMMICIGSKVGLFVVVAMMGAQSALFSPSKSGSIPELLPESKIAGANGLFGLATVVSTVVGTGIGNLLTDVTFPKGQHNWWISATVVIGVACVGLCSSYFVKSIPAANPTRRFPWDAVSQTWRDLKQLASYRPLLRVAIGVTFFWSLGTIANLNIDQYAFAGGASEQRDMTALLISLVVGIGLGSILAGYWSGGRVELGILPLGALGLVISSLLLFLVRGQLFVFTDTNEITWSYIWACIFLVLLGTSAGLFHVPLEAYLQHRSPPASRGSILASANFLTFVGVLLASLLFWLMRNPLSNGSVEYLDYVEYSQVSPAVAHEIERSAEEFAAEFFVDHEITPRDFWGRFDTRAAQQEAAARLAWIEWQLRQEFEGGANRNEFFARYREFPRLGVEVIDEAEGHSPLHPRDVFLVCGILTIPVLVYIVLLVPEATVRFAVWLVSRVFYRIRLHGLDNIPEQGPVLLVANHISWLDGVLLMLVSPRRVRMLVWQGPMFRNRILLYLADVFGAILITTSPKSIKRGLDAAREGLAQGDVVGIFAEGGISRTGQVQAFKPGMMKIVAGTGATIVPVYLDELWGSIFSYSGGRFFWKWPRKYPYPVSIFFGKPLPAGSGLYEVRQAVMELGAEAVNDRQNTHVTLPKAMIRACKRRKRGSKVADSNGTDLSGGDCLLRTMILLRILRREVLSPDEKYVGVLLPPSAGGVLANMALALDRRISANLNYTVTSDVLNACIKAAGIKHVLTSRRFMSKMDFKLDAKLVYLEDFKDKATWQDKVAAAVAAYVMPSSILEWSLKLKSLKPDDVVTIIFTSGSTGTPKGVMLTYENIACNTEAIDQLIKLTPSDVILGVLPFFHSFGYTVTLWTVMALDIKAVYHYSPIDGKRIGALAQEHNATVLLATPTFLRNYLRRCTKEQFSKLDVVVAGAEKLPISLCDAFEEKFGIRPVEGYGCTETSPLVSVNIPPSRAPKIGSSGLKEGSVGRPISGVVARVTDLDTGAELPANRDGMLWIKGPNIMKGYLNQPEKTAEVIQDGWYMTGDVAHVDEEGFIVITGRESRFSKIGGEMVPHLLIEEMLNRFLEADEEVGLKAVVTAVPDEKRGERLVVLHLKVDKTPQEMCDALLSQGIPNLFLPSVDSFFEVPAIPILGTGKLDLKQMRDIADEKTNPSL
jgi:acyl-[acyl-carrier-protein]-phospholipid O-acyltransferase/long-chain-fatty-acid--[acyl-carrier-protein] ligase